jgi:hypothetical protein
VCSTAGYSTGAATPNVFNSTPRARLTSTAGSATPLVWGFNSLALKEVPSTRTQKILGPGSEHLLAPHGATGEVAPLRRRASGSWVRPTDWCVAG